MVAVAVVSEVSVGSTATAALSTLSRCWSAIQLSRPSVCACSSGAMTIGRGYLAHNGKLDIAQVAMSSIS
jgi:hypothetical protein